MAPNQLIKKLDGDLVLRRSSTADAEKLAKFNGFIHNDPLVAEWAYDLLSGKHPVHGEDDFTVVENTQTGEIVSCMNLINQTWSYSGIPFGVGRPELVGTLPAYRNRGLVRQQFEVIHEWSRERGHLLQAITGIPWYYRMFGYEMAVDLDGSYKGFNPPKPQEPEGQPPKYHFRLAVQTDVPFITACYQHGCQRDLLACMWDEALFSVEMNKRPGNINRRALYVIESASGEAVGFLALNPNLADNTQFANRYELKSGISWQAVTPYVLRFLWETGKKLAADQQKECDAFGLEICENHPGFQVARAWLGQFGTPYGWYLRVADLPGFMHHITPVLEQRLANSICVGHTGNLDLNFYRSGLRLQFNQGRLEKIDTWKPSTDAWGHASFPDLTFLQVLFGYRTWEEVKYIRPDCWVGREDRALVEVLFPKQPSCIWPLS